MSDGTTTWTYTYDADGMRIGRTNGTDTYSYIYNGSLLSQMTRNGRDMFFTYDAMGMPATLTYRGIVFFYVTNLQGDVMALMDEEGNIVVEYLYDAWGNLLSTTGAMANTLGIWNPLTYRGYVYDHELEMYYLQSRYYDPMVGRFINADSYVSTGQGIIGYNMFAYCGNNSICRIDSVGTIWMSALRLIVKVVIKALKAEQPQKPSYLVNQDAEGIGNLGLGWTTVSHGGCGVLATYNALITLGEYPSFENVLSYYNQWGNNVAFGLLGIVPETVVKYFKQKGYKVIVSDNLDGIDIYSTTADACILWYTWIHDDGLPRAHFVHYNYDKGYSGYCAYNAGPYGWAYFKHPSEYILKKKAFYAVGIFIYR